VLDWWLISIEIDWSYQKKKCIIRKAQKRLSEFDIRKTIYLKLVVKIRKKTIVMRGILLVRAKEVKIRKRYLAKRFYWREK
jgi:hypothetical protein